MSVRTRTLAAAALATTLAGSLISLPGTAPVANATEDTPYQGTLSTPPDGVRGHALWDSYYELEPFGYQEAEWFISGTARNDDGTAEAPYTTRFIITMPTDEVEGGDIAEFNGTVLVDWTNVTAQFENAVDTMLMREELMRSGYGYVHVSAQSAGICCTPLTPQVWDPVRYADLAHPGDDFAQDIFRQVADAARTLSGADAIIAAGQSQSGSRLARYVKSYLVNTPAVRDSIDVVIVHGSHAANKHLLAEAADQVGVNVLHLLADSEANAETVATDYSHYRLWEIAGTAHADFWIGYQSEIGSSRHVIASAPKLSADEYAQVIRDAGNYGAEPHPMFGVCIAAGTTMPMHYAASAALVQTTTWADTGVAPPNGPRFEFNGTSLARDEHGNAMGGIRLPAIDVPIAEYRSTDCALGGTTVPFTDVKIRSLYPTFGDYFAAMADATRDAVAAGWLLPADGIDQMNRVCSAKVRWPEATFDPCPEFTLTVA